MTLSDVTTPGCSETESNGNEVVVRIPQISNITEDTLWYCLVSYTGHSLRESSYRSVKMQSVYSVAPAVWVLIYWFVNNIFIISSIQTIVSIFIVIFTRFRLMRSSAFYWCLLSNSGAHTGLRNVPLI